MTQQQIDRSANLADLNEVDLRNVIYARLQGNPTFGPVVDSRIGPEPFEWLSEQFRRGDAGLQHRMTAVLADYLDQLPDTERWPERARCALLDLIQDCGEPLIDHLYRLIRQRTFLKTEHLGPEVHAALLKCLISNGHHATPDFWLTQSEILGPEYGALIFSGLVDHGLELAMSHLPRLCVHEEAKTYVRWLFPHLQDKFGTAAVLKQLERIRSQLPADIYHLYRCDLLPAFEPNVAAARQNSAANRKSRRIRNRRLEYLERLEDRRLLVTDPQLAGILPEDIDLLLLNANTGGERSVRNLDDVFGEGTDILVQAGFGGAKTAPHQNHVIVRFAYTSSGNIEISSLDLAGIPAFENTSGQAYMTRPGGERDSFHFQLDVGTQVTSIVPQV